MTLQKKLSVLLSLFIIFSLLATPVSVLGAEQVIDTPAAEEPVVEEQQKARLTAHEHDWGTAWSKSKTHHWHECTADSCDVVVTVDKDGYAEHDYSVNNTCICGDVKVPVHEHDWNTAWTYKEGAHWHECIGEGTCDIEVNALKSGYAQCNYEANDKCVCGASKPEHIHVWKEKPSLKTSEYHWCECIAANCNLGTGGKDQPLHYGYAPHTFDKDGYCEGCSWTNNKHAHSWDETKFVYNETAHWHECTATGCWIDNAEYNKDYAAHKYDIDGKCEVCDYQSTHQHDWMDTWDKTSTDHFRPCSGKFTGECFLGNKHQYKPDYEAHIFNTDGYCIVCEWINTKNPHTHTWATEHTYDDKIHYRDCTDPECNITLEQYNIDYSTHQLNATGKCVCGYQAPHEHIWNTEYTTDIFYHWRKCVGPYDVCDITNIDEMENYGQHNYDETTDLCVCGKAKPISDIFDITNEGANVGGAAIAGAVEDSVEAILTEEEIAFQKHFGLDVDFWLAVNDATGSISESDKQLIKDLLKGNSSYEIGKHLDIELWKKIETRVAEQITNLNGKITVELELPDELKNTRDDIIRTYGVVRLHNGVAELINCNYDRTTNVLSFETDRFSNYTIVYEDTVVVTADAPQKVVVTADAPQKDDIDKSPNTGDTNVIPYVLALAIISGAILLWICKTDRKRKNAY